jgi:hypothetical protein
VEFGGRVEVETQMKLDILARRLGSSVGEELIDGRRIEYDPRQFLGVGRLIDTDLLKCIDVDLEYIVDVEPIVVRFTDDLEPEVDIKAVAMAIPSQPQLKVGISSHV